MSQKILDYGPEWRIPVRTGGATPPTERVYVLTIDPAEPYLNFKYKQDPGDRKTTDQPLDIRVPGPDSCKITLNLDSDWNWNFRASDNQADAVMLSAVSTASVPATSRYYNFFYNGPKSVSFCADFYNQAGNVDAINIYIVLDQLVAGSQAATLPIFVDPHIRNPGDPTNLKPKKDA